jgi:hypothetical protein
VTIINPGEIGYQVSASFTLRFENGNMDIVQMELIFHSTIYFHSNFLQKRKDILLQEEASLVMGQPIRIYTAW